MSTLLGQDENISSKDEVAVHLVQLSYIYDKKHCFLKKTYFYCTSKKNLIKTRIVLTPIKAYVFS